MDVSGVTAVITPGEKSLVGKIAGKVLKRYCSGGINGQMEYDELFNLGIIGLLEAKSRFDPDRGIPFPVFASSRIRGAMLDQIRQQPMVRISQELAQKIRMLKSAQDQLANQQKTVSEHGLAELLGWSVQEVRKVSRQMIYMVPAKESLENEERGYWQDPGEIIVEKDVDAEHRVIFRQLGKAVGQCLKELPSDEYRLILIGRVVENLNLKELARVLDCSNQTVANRQQKAQELMKNCLEKKGWSSDIFHELQK